MDRSSAATAQGNGAVREIKEWQAIMDHLQALPVKGPGELPVIPVDERAAEVRVIGLGGIESSTAAALKISCGPTSLPS
jgi:5'-nucleotidase